MFGLVSELRAEGRRPASGEGRPLGQQVGLRLGQYGDLLEHSGKAGEGPDVQALDFAAGLGTGPCGPGLDDADEQQASSPRTSRSRPLQDAGPSDRSRAMPAKRPGPARTRRPQTRAGHELCTALIDSPSHGCRSIKAARSKGDVRWSTPPAPLGP